MKKRKNIALVLIISIFVVSVLLISSIALNINVVYQKIRLLSNDTKAIMLILLLFVIVLMLLLLIHELIRIKKGPEESVREIKIDNVVSDSIPVISGGVDESKTENADSRFYQLTQIDKENLEKEKKKFNNSLSLKEFCDDFRNFASYKLKLYYDISDIRRFIAGMAVSKLLILQGMSGTGKTSLAYAMGEFLDNTSTVVPIQPMWKERTDLIGYYNEFTKKFNETELLQKMYEANYSDEIFVVVLDELNIARVEYYFAEFLSLLEIPNPEGRYLDVVSDKWDSDPKQLKKGRIKLPENMWFIGTANNDDSTFAISDKVYDRAMVMNLDKKSEIFTGARTDRKSITYKYFTTLVKEALKEYEITTRNQKRIKELDAYMIREFHITFGNRIMKQINSYVPVYVACGGDEVEAIDDFLSKKVLRKLESQNQVYIKSKADNFCNKLDDLFGEDKMSLCKELIERIKDNA